MECIPQTPAQGANTTCYLAVSEEVAEESGHYYVNCKVRNILEAYKAVSQLTIRRPSLPLPLRSGHLDKKRYAMC